MAYMILFSWNRKFGAQLYLETQSMAPAPRRRRLDLGAGFPVNTWDWSRDGKYVLVRKGNELWYLLLARASSQAAAVRQSGRYRTRSFPPMADGWHTPRTRRGVMWRSHASPLPSANGKWQAPALGEKSAEMAARTARELFYLSAGRKMMAVAVTKGARACSRLRLCAVPDTQRRRQPISSFAVFSHDVMGDFGQRFLIITSVDEASAAPLSVFLNWASEMEK